MNSKDSEILQLLLQNKTIDLNISQIATLLKKDYKNIHTAVKRLEEASIVTLQRFGKSYKVKLVNILNTLLFEAEYNRKMELLKNKDLKVMFGYFNGMKTSLYVMLVFGSYAKKTQAKHSDIDLMFIVPDDAEESMEREIKSTAGILPLPLHVNIFKEKDFRAMSKSREFTVGSEAISHNVILHGVEAYYEMIR